MSKGYPVVALAIAAGAFSFAAMAAGEEIPPFKRAVPEKFFDCERSDQCVVVQGWCATFSINSSKLSDFEKLLPKSDGKAPSPCPPGWLPPSPRPMCVNSKCEVASQPR